MSIEETSVESTESTVDSSAPETTTPETTSSSAPETSEAEVIESTEETPAYTPNFKFKYAVQGKNSAEEKEFDDLVKPLIKDAETEKKFRDLYEKAYGLDFVKPRYQELKTQHHTTKQEFDALTSELKQLGEHISKKDVGTVATMLGLSKEDIFNWVRSELQYQELPQEERQRIEQQRALEQRALSGEQQLKAIQQQYENTAVEFRNMQLDSAIGQPQVASLAKEVDAKLGEGAFRAEVILLGQQVYQSTGRDISVQEAVQYVTKKYAPFIGSTQTMENAMSEKEEKGPTMPRKVPVIPHVSGRSTSPTKKVVSSLDELKKKQQELAATTIDNE